MKAVGCFPLHLDGGAARRPGSCPAPRRRRRLRGGGVLGADLGSSSGGGEDVSGARTPPHPASPPPDENDRATAAAVLTAAMEPKPGPRRLLASADFAEADGREEGAATAFPTQLDASM